LRFLANFFEKAPKKLAGLLEKVPKEHKVEKKAGGIPFPTRKYYPLFDLARKHKTA